MEPGKRKSIELQEESRQTKRRTRSDEIIALEGKRKKEKESEDLDRKNNSADTKNRNEGNGKGIVDVDDEQHSLESLPMTKMPPATPSTKPHHGGQPIASRHARFRHKPSDKNIGTPACTTLEIEKRDKHLQPNNKSLCAQVLNAPKPSIQGGYISASHVAKYLYSGSHQSENFLGLLCLPEDHFNITHEQGQNQAFPISFGYKDFQARLGQVNPMGPFPLMQPNPFPLMQPNPLRGNMNQPEEDQDKGKERERNGKGKGKKER